MLVRSFQVIEDVMKLIELPTIKIQNSYTRSMISFIIAAQADQWSFTYKTRVSDKIYVTVWTKLNFFWYVHVKKCATVVTHGKFMIISILNGRATKFFHWFFFTRFYDPVAWASRLLRCPRSRILGLDEMFWCASIREFSVADDACSMGTRISGVYRTRICNVVSCDSDACSCDSNLDRHVGSDCSKDFAP